MAAVATTKTVKVTINDIEIDVPAGELVVEAVKRVGLEIPVFCYHPRMKPVGMCRMCLVEIGSKQPDGTVKKMPKPQAGCTMPVTEGMVIYTDTESVRRDRKGVLEFLLINHPLDCPICDRGGECPLQNNTLAYGPSTSRFIELKRHLPKAFPLSKYITLDLERCIQCGRCVRFTEEISGDHQLAFRFRGALMQPSTFQMTDYEGKFTGNVIEICPVGALTSSKYRFRARPWDLEARKGLCTLTADGTNVWMDVRAGKLVRISGRTNEAVNEEWTSDKTKFGHEFYNSANRVLACNLRQGEGFKGATWPEAYKEIIPRFMDKGEEVAILAAPDLSNEALFMAREMAEKIFATANLDSRFDFVLPSATDTIKAKYGVDEVQGKIVDLESAKTAVVFGCSLADDQPMSFLRLRKAWMNGGCNITTIGEAKSEVDAFAESSIVVEPGKLADAARALAVACGVPGVTGSTSEPFHRLAASLKEGGGTILATYSLMQSADGARAAEILAAIASTTGATLDLLKNQANAEGASAIGFKPGANGLDTRGILEACRDGKIKALWLAGCDPISDFPDKELATAALENVDFLVVQTAMPNEAVAFASLVLPLSLPAEQDGTYTSSERRVQRMNSPLVTPGEAKAAFRVFAEIIARAKPGATPPSFMASEIMVRMFKSVPAFNDLTVEALNGEGALLARDKDLKGEWGALARTISEI